MDNKKKDLNGKEKLDLTVEAGLQLIPVVGGALSSLYFGTKQEKRFKRLESFYQEISEQIKESNVDLIPIENHNKEKLISIIEELNEKVERESSESKRNMFKNYFLTTLTTPTNDNFDERRYFLEILSSLSALECEVLIFLKRKGAVLVGSLSKPDTDPYAILGSIGRLRSYVFLVTKTNGISIGGDEDNSFNEFVSISSFGNKFISYCIE